VAALESGAGPVGVDGRWEVLVGLPHLALGRPLLEDAWQVRHPVGAPGAEGPHAPGDALVVEADDLRRVTDEVALASGVGSLDDRAGQVELPERVLDHLDVAVEADEAAVERGRELADALGVSRSGSTETNTTRTCWVVTPSELIADAMVRRWMGQMSGQEV
jgi:hypothetical protein